MNYLKKILKQDKYFFSILFILLLFLFRKAFQLEFILDDYFFLSISKANSVADVLNFFSPFRDYSYKPVATELFYFLINNINGSYFFGHIVVFATYGVGLFFLYKIILQLAGKELLAKLITFLYAIHFTHVFQLYYLGTYQEVAIFTFLTISFYGFLKKMTAVSLFFFGLALLSKETAILFFPFLAGYVFIQGKYRTSLKIIKPLIPYFVLGIVFFGLYQYSLQRVTALDNYKPQLQPKLIMNNLMWYSLWGVGIPNFFPDFFVSILKPPIGKFWELMGIYEVKMQMRFLVIYVISFLISILLFLTKSGNKIKPVSKVIFFSLCGFFIFIAPILLFMHKWMVRLTLPLIFLVIIQGYLIYLLIKSRSTLIKGAGILLVVLYFLWNFYGITVHESSSSYLLESRISRNLRLYLSERKGEITKYKYIYFQDPGADMSNPWGGSEKLKITLHDQSFVDHFFPDKNLKVIYSFENKKIPPRAYIIQSVEILTK